MVSIVAAVASHQVYWWARCGMDVQAPKRVMQQINALPEIWWLLSEFLSMNKFTSPTGVLQKTLKPLESILMNIKFQPMTSIGAHCFRTTEIHDILASWCPWTCIGSLRLFHGHCTQRWGQIHQNCGRFSCTGKTYHKDAVHAHCYTKAFRQLSATFSRELLGFHAVKCLDISLEAIL